MMRIHALIRSTVLVLAFAAAGTAAAQTATARGERLRAEFEQRFAAADRDHDGRLSRQEAESMPAVLRNFDRIDTSGSGYVTKEAVLRFGTAMLAERRGQR